MRKTGQRDLFPGALEMMILRILKRKPSHGYALVQDIKRTSHDLLQIEEGSLYPAHDPMTFAVVAALLILVALLACYIPARRAMPSSGWYRVP